MRKLTLVLAVLGAGGASAITADAHAWGDEGHKIVCEIAFTKVKATTRAAIVELIQADTDNPFPTFSEACTWPDHPRKRAAEHFVNLPRDATSLTNKCGVADECVVTAIADDFAVLSSNTATKIDKSRSLKFLGHWVGDVHQPLHVSFKDDRGGNEVQVSGECSDNLHSTWDTCLVKAAVGTNAKTAADRLFDAITQAQIQEWTQSEPRQWANESFKITESVKTKYCEMHGSSCDQPSGTVMIDQAYIDTNAPIVSEQLQKAGIRLAFLLDRALGD